MTIGVTTGKFYPFHKGHDYLIRQAKAQVDKLVVLVGYKPEQTISGEIRAAWLREMHPDIEIILALEDIPNENEAWAKRTLELLSPRKPDVVFTSEDYGAGWAELMNCSHVTIDKVREQFPISATQLRADLAAHWEMLTPPAKAYFAKRIVCIGVESSGTTTLAQALAQHYQTVWIPEYGRWYWEGRRYIPNQELWNTDEFVKIAHGQAQWEDDLARRANKLVVCDTDPLATHIWHRRYVGHFAPEVQEIADSRHYDLYIVTEPDFGFVQDGTREGEHIREQMHKWFIGALETSGRHYIRVWGDHDRRMKDATQHIDTLLKFPKIVEP
jgi:HTH-type transcriptional regulator, transcriptional repressor of NAD biosynthesis genes